MWKPEIPAELYATMDERFIYESFNGISNMPPYSQEGVHYTDKQIREAQETPVGLLADELWCAMEIGYARWLIQSEVCALIHMEKCANCLNAFAPRFELVGAEVFNTWAKKAQVLFGPLGIPFNQPLDTNGLERAMSQMEECSIYQPALSNSIFAINRRRFVEDAKIIDKGDVFRYLLDQCGSHTDENFLFRQARQIIRANGDLAPIEW